jgi:hypothetical protein
MPQGLLLDELALRLLIRQMHHELVRPPGIDDHLEGLQLRVPVRAVPGETT